MLSFHAMNRSGHKAHKEIQRFGMAVDTAEQEDTGGGHGKRKGGLSGCMIQVRYLHRNSTQ